MKDYFSITDFEFRDKKVLTRVGFDIQADEKGTLKSDKRILSSLKTFQYLLDHEAKQIICMTHIGRPKNKEKELQSNAVAQRLSELLHIPVAKIDDWGERGLPSSKIVFLENLRFNSGEKEKDETKRKTFANQLASLADVYVNEAFSNSHRTHASMTDVCQYIPGCLGFGTEFEISTIQNTLKSPSHPFLSIIGGLKADKVNAIKNLLHKADEIMVGGSLALLFQRIKGYSIGSTKVDEEGLSISLETINNQKIILPLDYVIADSFSNDARTKIVDARDIPDGWMALDIGPKTIAFYEQKLSSAKTIIWNGPLGVFEMEKFSRATKDIGIAISKINAVKIVGGGDSAAAVEKFKLENKMTLVSTGGGASLMMFEGQELPAITALKHSYQKFKDIV